MKIFITGVSRGLGKALVEECLGRGHEVRGIARTPPHDVRGNFHFYPCDLSRAEDIQRTLEELNRSAWLPDIVILNAAIMQQDVDESIDMAAVRKTIEVNCLGNIAWASFFLPFFRARRDGGVFINISSVSSFRGIVRKKIAYPASKAALDMLFEGLRLNFGSDHVRFITIHLGPLSESRSVPLVTRSYRETAVKVLSIAGRKRSGSVISYPLITGLLYRLSRVLPDRILRGTVVAWLSSTDRKGP